MKLTNPSLPGLVFHSLSKPSPVLYTPSIWWITTLRYLAVNFSFYIVYGVPGDIPHGRINAFQIEALFDGEGSGDGILVAPRHLGALGLPEEVGPGLGAGLGHHVPKLPAREVSIGVDVERAQAACFNGTPCKWSQP